MPALSNVTTKDGVSIVQLDEFYVVVAQKYNSTEKLGVTITVVCAALSLACVSFILGVMVFGYWKHRNNTSSHFFVRSHAAAYFICLLLSDALQGTGTLMSSKWIQNGSIVLDGYCSAQGAIKNVGNLGISLWTLALAVHTFTVLFLRWNPRDWALYATLIGVWLLIGFIAMIGPAAIQKANRGPYFGISGLWCWITDSYPAERIAMEYMWMLGSAFLSFCFYTATFLRLRGNIYVESGRMKFRRVTATNSWQYVEGRDSIDLELTNVAKGMIGFPVLFTIVVVPIAITRFIDWSGKPVPDDATLFAAAVFSLTGVFDLVLFLMTRSLLPNESFFHGARVAPRPKAYKKGMTQDGVQPYIVSDFFSAHGFNRVDSIDQEKQIESSPVAQTYLGVNRSASSGSNSRLPAIDTLNVGQRGSIPDIRVDGRTPVSAWDDIDIDNSRQIQPVADSFGEEHMSRPERGREQQRSRSPPRRISSSSTRI